MSEKRERRCETCAAWLREEHALTRGSCHARSPDGSQNTSFANTEEYEFCMVDYTPLDMIDGLPDARELLERIQSNMNLLDRQWKRLGELESRLDSFANGVESTRDVLIEIERRHGNEDEVAMGDDA